MREGEGWRSLLPEGKNCTQRGMLNYNSSGSNNCYKGSPLSLSHSV